ncbi:hypothetical protein N7517_008720 [Penicillium concentricum]|uniref:Uncharacterized protein n=1 Tax=Penicillium concentricum TaxID=293559 RepID=A0A9W9RV44_9EURO|nr:uncharacterized protein N7517_008720 [Penicillium concentricum]KAJ5365834.1 hypothetical protein N7517_008720 [Penicillium concentricum]
MDNHPRRSAIPSSSGLPNQEDTTGFTNEPTGASQHIGSNESASTNEPVAANEPAGTNAPLESGPSHWASDTTLEVLQTNLEADTESNSDEDGEVRVHPDFYVHLARLQRINEANRVNARREVEAQYQASQSSRVLNESQNQASHMLNEFQHQVSRMLNQSQHEASMMLNETQHQVSQMLNESQNQASRILTQSQREASQILNDPRRGSSQSANQPLHYASAERGSQPWAMGMPARFETQPSISAGPFEPIPHARFDTPDPTGAAHPGDHSSHNRPPSPYPMITQRRSSADPSPLSNPPLIAPPMVAPPMTAPQPPRYTEYGNPYTLAREPDLMPEGAIAYAPDRMLQAWLLRAQLIAGVRPENLQPMSNPQNLRFRTPPWIMMNENGAYIVRMEPARFHGVMLPMPDLPWFPRRANPNSSTALASSNAPDASSLPIASNAATAPSFASTQNSPVGHELSAPTSSDADLPVDTDLSTAVESLFAPPVRPPQIRSAIPRQFRSDPLYSPFHPGISAPPNTPAGPNLSTPESSAASSEAVNGNGNGNGVVPHGVTWSEPEDSEEDPEELVSPRLRRFLLDGADD